MTRAAVKHDAKYSGARCAAVFGVVFDGSTRAVLDGASCAICDGTSRHI